MNHTVMFQPVEGVMYQIRIGGKLYNLKYSTKHSAYMGEEAKAPEYELIGNENQLQSLRGQIELLRFQYKQLKKTKVREKTLSEASYEELAKEMWKRCAENTSLV